MITFEDWQKIDVRVGKIIEVTNFPEARKPSYKLKIDFGFEVGVKQSCGQFVQNYTKDEILGKFVACLVNLPARQMGPAISEVLTLGFPDDKGQAVLIVPDKTVLLGGQLY